MKKISLILIICCTVSCARQVKSDIRIISYNGKVTVNTQAVKEIDIPLNYGDAVSTMPGSTCDIIINGKNILRLKPDTSLSLKISGTENILRVDKGVLAGVIPNVFTENGIITLEAPSVTASFTGAAFCLKAENEKSTYICVCNGIIELKGKNSSSGERVEAAHHTAKKYTIDKNGALIEDHAPGILYHNDSEIEAMAKIINETVDWNRAYTK